MPQKVRDSEFHAYTYIKNELEVLGWDTRNPARNAAGQVYTQNECLSHPEIKACLGLDKPENVIKVTETKLWVIEAKPYHKEIEKALKEAEGYAAKINKSKNVQAAFVSGVAGNPTDGYEIKTKYLVGGKFKTITFNGRDITSLISPDIARAVMTSGHVLNDVPIDEKLFLSKAEKINEHLHLGAINKNYRARVMAALLLSMIDEPGPNVDAKPSVLISEINARARSILAIHEKPSFFKYIEIALPPTEDNHVKFKKALVQTMGELKNLNIRAAMDSGTDVLGKFYEVFLKYGNGAKEIGIVLTPRHITKFAVDVIGVSDRDVVYDPTCGTGGFLVAAFDHVKQKHSKAAVNKFKQKCLFGVEQEAEVVALAIVNMIFRGDGKNNIIEGGCFQKNLVIADEGGGIQYSKHPPEGEKEVVTRVLMNPPFALKSSDEKEFKFVDQALKQMQDGGLLFSVLPYSAMVKPGAYQEWREKLLKKNSLLCAITFPEDLFYPVGVHTVGIFIKKGVPQPISQNVLWVRATNDGLLKRKGKRLPNPKAKNDYPIIQNTVQAFISNQLTEVTGIDKFQKVCPIDYSDPLLELVPENYLDQAPPTDEEIREGIEQIIRDSVAFLIREKKD